MKKLITSLLLSLQLLSPLSVLANEIQTPKLATSNSFLLTASCTSTLQDRDYSLSSNAPFTPNQLQFIREIKAGRTTFVTRSKIKTITDHLPQSSPIKIESFISTVGDGSGGVNITVNNLLQ